MVATDPPAVQVDGGLVARPLETDDPARTGRGGDRRSRRYQPTRERLTSGRGRSSRAGRSTARQRLCPLEPELPPAPPPHGDRVGLDETSGARSGTSPKVQQDSSRGETRPARMHAPSTHRMKAPLSRQKVAKKTGGPKGPPGRGRRDTAHYRRTQRCRQSHPAWSLQAGGGKASPYARLVDLVLDALDLTLGLAAGGLDLTLRLTPVAAEEAGVAVRR